MTDLKNSEAMIAHDEKTLLAKQVGFLTSEACSKYIEDWRSVLQKRKGIQMPHDERRRSLHEQLQLWVGQPKRDKSILVKSILENPIDAEEIQSVAQWLLTANKNKYPFVAEDGNLVLYRFVRQEALTAAGSPDKLIKPYQSLTSNLEFAERNTHLYGMKGGEVLKVTIPIENVLTFYDAHPAFINRPEGEVILNENGIFGGNVVQLQ